MLEHVNKYINLLEELDVKLVKVIDTHIHADHISGIAELRDRTNCITIMGDACPADVVSMKVSDNVEEEEDEPSVFYMSEHHAREPISLEVTMYIMHHLLSNYGDDPDITSEIDYKQIWFIPLVNPDGH